MSPTCLFESFLFVAVLGLADVFGHMCHLSNPDVIAELDSSQIVLQGVALNNMTNSSAPENSDRPNNTQYSRNNTEEISFLILQILKGKWRMANVQALTLTNVATQSPDECGSQITIGVKYLIFLKNFFSVAPKNSSVPFVSALERESISLILVSSVETVELIVQRNAKQKSYWLRASLAESEVKVITGMKIQLVCQISGSPTPAIKWYKNKLPLFPDARIKLITKRFESKLSIHRAESRDAGVYKCQASNRRGESRSAFTTIHVANESKPRFAGTRCQDDVFCFNHGRCYQSNILGSKFCMCSSEFTGFRCAARKSRLSYRLQDVKQSASPWLFRPETEVLIIVMGVVVLLCTSLIIMIAVLARKLCCSPAKKVQVFDAKSEEHISPKHLQRAQVEVTNLVFVEQTSESNFGESDSKLSADSLRDLSLPDAAVVKSKSGLVDDSFQNRSEKSVPVDLEDDSDPTDNDYEPCLVLNAACHSDKSDSIKWCLETHTSDVEAQRESDVDMREVEPSGDELCCPSRGLSEMSSRCDTSSRTSTSMDCDSNSSADLSQRLLRHLQAFPQFGEPTSEKEDEREEDLSLEEFLGRHCLTMGALPDLNDYLGTMDIDDSIMGSYPGSRNMNSYTSET